MDDTVIVSKNKDVILKHQRNNEKTSSDQGLDEAKPMDINLSI